MASTFGDRLRHAWNAFNDNDIYTSYPASVEIGPISGDRPDRRRIISGSERTIISSIYTRIGVDVAMTTFEHVRVDENERYSETLKSGLNYCLTTEANIDQTGYGFLLDAVISMLDEGVVAVVPIDTTTNPYRGSFDINTMRVGKIVGWHPRFVDVQVYNDQNGQIQQITMAKKDVAILENPFYAVMNEPNSTLKRLVYKLGLLDDADAKANSPKLDLIVQLPYTVKSKMQEDRADKRKKSIEDQLTNSKYGIAYIDATEKITQLNRPVENNLMSQINDLKGLLYSQLGIDETILNGTASPETMNNYYQRTVAAIVNVIKTEFARKFLTKTARSQGQTIMSFQDPFRYLTVTQIAQMADSLSRNEILSPNDFRQALGFKPDANPQSDELRNRNLIDVSQVSGQPAEQVDPNAGYDQVVEPSSEDPYAQNGSAE